MKMMLGNNLPRSNMAPDKIMAVQVTKVTPNVAYRMSGMSEFARLGYASTLYNTPLERSPRMGLVVCAW